MPGIEPRESANEKRLRPHMSVTVHPETPRKLDALCARYATTKGRIVDILVERLYVMATTGKMRCMTGEVCRVGREDVPAVL